MKIETMEVLFYGAAIFLCLLGAVVVWTDQQRRVESTPIPRALPAGVTKFHDASDEVTCWVHPQGGMACLPDNWLASMAEEAP